MAVGVILQSGRLCVAAVKKRELCVSTLKGRV